MFLKNLDPGFQFVDSLLQEKDFLYRWDFRLIRKFLYSQSMTIKIGLAYANTWANQ
jgi:hypothetical protein